MSFGAAQGLVATSVLPEVMPSPDLSDFAPNDPTIGDLLVGDGTNWDDFPIGADTFVLTADSGEASGLKWAAIPAGITTFVGLSDTPANFTSQTLKVLRVNAGETAVEFVGVTGTGSAVFDGSPTITTPTIASFANSAHNHADAAGGGQITLTTGVTGVLPVANGGTALAVYVVGDILHATATTTIAGLAGVATGNAIISGGIGVVSSYGKIGLTTHISGTLATGNGGTGVTGASTGSGGVVLDTSPTIVTPTIASFANAGHSHTDAAGGGTLNASAIAAGTLTLERGGTELDSSAVTDGQLLIGNSTGNVFALSTLTAGTDIGIVNAGGTITISFTGSADTHALLSATHTDTTAATVVRGDLITGQTATPEWTRLAIGTNTQVLTSDGTDIAWATPAAAGVSDLDGAYEGGNVINVDTPGAPVTMTGGGSVPSVLDSTMLLLHDSTTTASDCKLVMQSGTAGNTVIEIHRFDLNFDDNNNLMSFISPGGDPLIDFDGSVGPTIFNEGGAAFIDHRFEGDTLPYMIFMDATATTENIAFLTTAAPNWQTMDRGFFVGDVTTAPTAQGTAGLFMWSAASTLTLAGGMVINELSLDSDTRIESNDDTHSFFLDAGTRNLVLCGASAVPGFQSMVRGSFFGDVVTAPTGDPTAGGFMYSNSGAGTWRNPSGQITVFGPAGPHCEICGYDSWRIAQFNPTRKSWNFECGNCGMVAKSGPDNILADLTGEQKLELVGPNSTFEDVKSAMKVVS